MRILGGGSGFLVQETRRKCEQMRKEESGACMQLGLAIRVATRWHDSKTTRILRNKNNTNSGRVKFRSPEIDTEKNGPCSGWTRVTRTWPVFSCQFRVKFRVNFGSISCQLRVHFESILSQPEYDPVPIQICPVRVQFRVDFGSFSCRGSFSIRVMSRVAGQFCVAGHFRFVSCQPVSGSYRVRVACCTNFRVAGRVRVRGKKIWHGSNTTRDTNCHP